MSNLISRRRIFALSGGTALALALAGCASAPSGETDVQLLSAGLAAIENGLAALGVNIPADIKTKADQLITTIQANLAILEGDAAPGQSTLQLIKSAINALSILLTPFFPAAGGIGLALSAALSLASVILGAFGVGGLTLRAGAPSPDEARAILRRAEAAGTVAP